MRYTILVIDDQWSMQELARIVLQAAGYRVLLAGDGATGASLARRHRPDLIVLDLHMPGMSGYAVLRHLARDARTASVPVLLITATGDTVPLTHSAPVTPLQKPFHPQALQVMVDQTLHESPMPIAV